MPSVDTDDLSLAYADDGVLPVLLIHGWPDDASTLNDVVPALTGAGLRPVVPALRGVGDHAISFARRNADRNPGVMAMDLVALTDAIGVERFAMVAVLGEIPPSFLTAADTERVSAINTNGDAS